MIFAIKVKNDPAFVQKKKTCILLCELNKKNKFTYLYLGIYNIYIRNENVHV